MTHRRAYAGALLVLTAACGTSEPTTTTSSSSTAAGGTSGSGGADAAGGTVSHPTTPRAEFIPEATGPCPALTKGTVTFSPDGVARDVLLWIDPAKAKAGDGPLVFFWHGVGGDPSEASYALGSALSAVTDMGGVVAAPYPGPGGTILPWALCLGGNDESDLRLADEVLACAASTVGIDLRRIYSVGFSAGAMHTEQFAARRSGYLAAIVAYSGARLGSPDEQDPTNLYPAMLFHGGPQDQVSVNFATSTETYYQTLVSEGHFAFICSHGLGHTVPSNGRAPAWQFLQDHPFGVTPEPYAEGLPAEFPSYCTL